MDKYCVILVAMGGPESIEDIRSYLYNIFSDRAIIRLPGGAVLQQPFARLISGLRYKKVQEHYGLIGGRSPLLGWTETQAAHMEQILQADTPATRCYVGMRYFRPFIDDVVRKAYQDGFRRFCFVPMYPQYSTATTGSSYTMAARALRPLTGAQATFIKDYHDDEAFIGVLRRYIADNIRPDETLLYSAHSLPQKFVDEGDPYVDQIMRTAQLSAGGRQYVVSFQSRTGPVKWVGPDTIVEVNRLLEDPSRKLFIVPIAFVCDHIETMYELDIELKSLVPQGSADRIRRMPMFNDDPALAQALAGLVRERMMSHAQV